MARNRRSRTKARTTWMLMSTALGELKIEAAMSAPCSVNTRGRYFLCSPRPSLRSQFATLKIRSLPWSERRRNRQGSGRHSASPARCPASRAGLSARGTSGPTRWLLTSDALLASRGEGAGAPHRRAPLGCLSPRGRGAPAWPEFTSSTVKASAGPRPGRRGCDCPRDTPCCPRAARLTGQGADPRARYACWG